MTKEREQLECTDLEDLVTQSNLLEVRFPTDASNDDKVTLIGACLLLDMLLFQNNNGEVISTVQQWCLAS
jgi:hypothetical protein